MQLSGSEKKIVEAPADSCAVEEGSVLVFLLYGDPVRMLFLAQLKAGDPVPCVEGQRFLLAPANEAKLTGAQGSPAELRKFAAEIGVELPLAPTGDTDGSHGLLLSIWRRGQAA